MINIIEIIEHTIKDTLKLVPFLFIAFAILEYIEHKMNHKNQKLIQKSGKFGPLLGGVLGIFPQCGFSITVTNLYAARIITLGTLISIYLTTSDEMLPLMISHNIAYSTIIKILFIKFLIGIICGFVIDIFLKGKEKNTISEFCRDEHCDCKHGILKSSLIHTLKIVLFIIITTFILNVFIHMIGEDNLSNLLTNNKYLGPIISSLLGLIPNCASSVIITELYLNNIISVGSMMAGLLTGSGVALLVLFRVNKNISENLKILLIVYFVGVISGLFINMLGISF